MNNVEEFWHIAPPRADASKLRARLDASPTPLIAHDSQHADCVPAPGLTEITEIAPGQPDPASGDGESRPSTPALEDLNIDRIYDPVYQAFLATGLLQPR
jgi:hypothetical protein